jgi:RNA polymerase sigma-70 factor, ECF subfamily
MIDQAVIRLRGGDKAAFRPIVEAFQAEVRTLIAGNGIALADVDDVAQATFLHVYQHIDQYEPGTNFRAWIRAIATYKVKALLEERRRDLRNRDLLLQYYLLEQTLAASGDERLDRAVRLEHCLGRLGERARSLVRRRYEGVPLTAIAEEWHRSVPAVKMMLVRIRNQLRDCIETQP